MTRHPPPHRPPRACLAAIEAAEQRADDARFLTEYATPHASSAHRRGGHVWKQDADGSWRCVGTASLPGCGARCWHPADVRMTCDEILEDRAAPRPGPRRRMPKEGEA